MGYVKKIINKWYIILICAFLTSGALYIEKSKVVPSLPQTGDMIYTRTIKFDKVPVFTAGGTTVETDLSKIMNTASSQDALMKSYEENFNVSELDKSIIKMNNLNKIKWIHKHFDVDKVGPGTYELVMKFDRLDAKNATYIKNNNVELMDTFESCFKKASSILVDDSKSHVLKEYDIVENLKSPQNNNNKKYAAIGFVLGTCLGVVIVMIWNVYHKI